MDNNKPRSAAKEIAVMGMAVALIETSKAALASLPNIELTTFWLMMFTLYFGQKTALIVPVFTLTEGIIYGMGLWWINYLYIWPALVFLTWLFRDRENVLFLAVFSGAFGLFFGAMCSVPYFFIGAASGGIKAGLGAAFSWWIAGIPFDILHCIGNFTLMLLLYSPVRAVMKRFG